MKPKRCEKISRTGVSLVIFAAFVFGLTAVTANSFHTSLRQFPS